MLLQLICWSARTQLYMNREIADAHAGRYAFPHQVSTPGGLLKAAVKPSALDSAIIREIMASNNGKGRTSRNVLLREKGGKICRAVR